MITIEQLKDAIAEALTKPCAMTGGHHRGMVCLMDVYYVFKEKGLVKNATEFAEYVDNNWKYFCHEVHTDCSFEFWSIRGMDDIRWRNRCNQWKARTGFYRDLKRFLTYKYVHIHAAGTLPLLGLKRQSLI